MGVDHMNVSDLRVKLFADGADLAEMRELALYPFIAGFTTNPTLMRKAGVTDYRAFAQTVLAAIPDKPMSFEVFADEFSEMERQARVIASWGDNVYVKIPITNTRGDSSYQLISYLCHRGIKVNVTAVLTLAQVGIATEALYCGAPSYISVFAGRIADTGVDPVPVMVEALHRMHKCPAELIWASPREVLNVFDADRIGCHIITATRDILNKIPLLGHDLAAYSLDTVQMFHDDALKSGFTL
jgi:transaldolase